MRRPVVRTTARKPVIHNRDHEHGGADPLRIHYEDVGDSGDGGGGGAVLPAYAAARVTDDVFVTGGFSAYLTFASVHSSGITLSAGGSTITIVTSGVYEVLAVGFASLGVDTSPALQMLIEVNGTGGDSGGYAFSQAALPVAIPSGGQWTVPMAVLDQLALDASDVLEFQAVSPYTTAGFSRWRIVVKQLA